MDKNQKIKFVEELNNEISDYNSLILIHYHGLNVNQVTELRRNLLQKNIKFKIAKNKLIKRAFKNSNFQNICDSLQGPTAMIYSCDPVANAKIVTDFANNNEKVKIIAGVLDAKLIDFEQIKFLSTLPSLDILRAKILGMINTPSTKVAQILQEVGAQVARVLKAREK